MSDVTKLVPPVTRPLASTANFVYVPEATPVDARVNTPLLLSAASPVTAKPVALAEPSPIQTVPLAKVFDTLLLNLVQSAANNRPRLAADEDGMLNECTEPDELTLKSVPRVLVVNV